MNAPQFSPVDDETYDLLTIVADAERVVGRSDVDAFLAACRKDAMAHDGIVSVNRVRALLSDQDIEHHRLSSFWSTFTGRGKPMVKTGQWETCSGSPSRNDGRPFALRRWVGEPS